MEAFRLHALFKNIPPFSLQKLLHFSSSSAANPSARRFVSDDLSADGSSIYRHTLKFQRPTTIKWCDRFHNSVSFIGSVDRPLERRYTIHGDLHVYTMLHVKPFREARRDVRLRTISFPLIISTSIDRIGFQFTLLIVSWKLTLCNLWTGYSCRCGIGWQKYLSSISNKMIWFMFQVN